MNVRHRLIGIAVVVLLAAVASFPAAVTRAGGEVFIVSNAALGGSEGGSFASFTTVLTACNSYTLRMNYNTQPAGTPAENVIGFQVWNNHGDALLTSTPFGERKWFAPSLKYYLESLRRSDVPSIEEVKFQIPCSDLSPSYTFKVFNYQPGGVLNYALSLPGGQEG